MNKCKKCNVVILDDTDRCPLCKHVLESDGIPGESRYPDAIATARKFRFVENLVLFISIVAECLLIAINFQVDREVAWSLVIGIILFIWKCGASHGDSGKIRISGQNRLSGTSLPL